MEKKVAIIISTYNQDILLEECLSSLKNKTDYKRYKVFLVDDGSKKKIGGKIKKKFSWVNVIINKKNLGFSKANNIGIRKALKNYSPDYVLLLNDDTEIKQKNWLKKMIKTGENDKKIGILGCKIIYPDGKLQNIGGYIRKWEITKIKDFKKNEIIDVDHVMGSCFLIKKEVIDEIGYLDEIYSPFLLEDTDYCLRAKKAGFLIKSVSSVSIIHKKGKTIDSLKNKKNLYIRFKNDIVFSIRHLKPKYAFFRIFIYLPLVAVLKKKKDTDELRMKNFKLRKNFWINLFLLLKALLLALYNINQISKNGRIKKV